MIFKNLTPHGISVELANGDFVHMKSEVESKDQLPRCVEIVTQMPEISGIPVVKKKFSQEVINLPPPQEGVIYIVSALTMLAAKRADVMAPGAEIRDSEGRIIGCKGLSAHPDL